MLNDAHFSDPPLQTVHDPLLAAKGVELKVLRLDLVHPLVSGNKWFKLKHNLALALRQGHDTVLSFGGAYSNHLVALAAAAKLSGLRSIAVVRGEPVAPLNPALAFMQQQGMLLHWVSRSDYRRKHEDSFKQALHAQFGEFFAIPEGGGNRLGLSGTAEIAKYLQFCSPHKAAYVMLACGTAATMAGILTALQGRQRVLGVSVLKGEDTLSAQVSAWLEEQGQEAPCAWDVLGNFHCGGYAKTSVELLQVMSRFSQLSGIELEPVYTGKMIYALYSLVEQGYFAQGSEIIAIHTGGLVAR